MGGLSTDERAEIIGLYEDLRVADVRDGMDYLMLHFYGSMSSEIRPLFRTRAIGFARTYRYGRYSGDMPHMSPEEYGEWIRWYYREIAPIIPDRDEIRDHDFVMIDAADLDAGLIGSNSGLNIKGRGTSGFVTSGGIRDTDELLLNQIPCWFKITSQNMNQARIQFEGCGERITVGGVLVQPDDLIVADGDGVIVVPHQHVREVAKWANQERESDKAMRRRLYEAQGIPLDSTVQ